MKKERRIKIAGVEKCSVRTCNKIGEHHHKKYYLYCKEHFDEKETRSYNNKKIYRQKKKDDPHFKLKARERYRRFYNNMNTCNNFNYRFNDLKSVSKRENVNLSITLDELKHILLNEKCYLTGIKISEHLKQTKVAYYLDRIGKKEYGGDGKRGGDYCIDNVRPCIFKTNELRDVLNITDKQAVLLFYPYRLYIKANNTINKIKDFFKNLLKKV